MTQAEALQRLDGLVLAATRGWGAACTAPITRAVVEWCRWMGAERVDLEQPATYYRHRRGRRHAVSGRVDVLARWRGGGTLAIEIDSANKRASLSKLRGLQAAGSRALWLRWDIHNRRQATCSRSRVATHFTTIAEPSCGGRRAADWREMLALLEGKP